MFKNAKVGDKVWDFVQGWGVISTVIDAQSVTRPIHVKFDNGLDEKYTINGTLYPDISNQTLFWDEIIFEVPKKPSPNLEVDTKVIVWDDGNQEKHRMHFHSFDDVGYIYTWADGLTSFTTKEYVGWDNWELYEENK